MPVKTYLEKAVFWEGKSYPAGEATIPDSLALALQIPPQPPSHEQEGKQEKTADAGQLRVPPQAVSEETKEVKLVQTKQKPPSKPKPDESSHA